MHDLKVSEIIDKAKLGFYETPAKRLDRNNEKAAFWLGYDDKKIPCPDERVPVRIYWQAGRNYFLMTHKLKILSDFRINALL